MRILIVSQYFWPESFVINDLSRALALDGHSVTVATGKPNYPSGRIWAGYTKSGTTFESFAEGIEVVRVPLHPREDAGALALCRNYLSFLLSGLWYFPRLLKGRDFDVVLFFGVSPVTSAIPAAMVAFQKKAHLAYWIQDLWPESLMATGMIKSRLVLSAVGLMVREIYRRADTIFLQSEAFAAPVSKYADTAKLSYLPNPAPMNTMEAELDLPVEVASAFNNCFSVLFAGNLGRAQSVDTIVDAARRVQDHPHIRVVVAGTGSEVLRMKDSIAQQGLTNIILIGLVDRALMPELFRRASSLLVTLRDAPGLGMVVPSKIQAYMQAGKPILGALNGEGARLIQDTGCGVVVEAENGEGLAKSILTLSATPASTLQDMGLRGRRYFEANFDVHSVAKRMVTIIENRMEAKP